MPYSVTCEACKYHNQNPYLPCAVHPRGPEADGCKDREIVECAEDGSRFQDVWDIPALDMSVVQRPSPQPRDELLEILRDHRKGTRIYKQLEAAGREPENPSAIFAEVAIQLFVISEEQALQRLEDHCLRNSMSALEVYQDLFDSMID